jgi:hypothetical protein
MVSIPLILFSFIILIATIVLFHICWLYQYSFPSWTNPARTQIEEWYVVRRRHGHGKSPRPLHSMGPHWRYHLSSQWCRLECSARQHHESRRCSDTGLLPRNTEHGLTSTLPWRPVALDPAATAVELANWKLEMDMHFAFRIYTGPKHAFISVDGQRGTGKQDSLKS